MRRCGRLGENPIAIAMSPNESIQTTFYNSKYEHGVDDKRRVQIPAKWKPGNAETELTLIAWPGPTGEKCLMVLPPDVWADLVGKLKAMPFSDPNAEALRRILGRDSDRVTLDKAGRICLPEELAKAAGIDKQALFIGLVDRFQIWSPDRYSRVAPADDILAPTAFKLV